MVRASFLVAVFGVGVAIITIGCSYDWTFNETTPVKDGDARADRPATGSQCKAAGDCLPGQYCRFSDGRCGPDYGGGIGLCVDAAQPCTNTAEKASCACDGTTVADACDAAKNGLDVDPTGAACSGVDRFKCPGVTRGCRRKVEYCLLNATSLGQGRCVTFTQGLSECSTCANCKEVNLPACACDDTNDPPSGLVVTCQ
jgi:hypothetical protein